MDKEINNSVYPYIIIVSYNYKIWENCFPGFLPIFFPFILLILHLDGEEI